MLDTSTPFVDSYRGRPAKELLFQVVNVMFELSKDHPGNFPLIYICFVIDLSGHVGTTPLHYTITVSLIYRCFTLLTRLSFSQLNK
jgi:hypothetical protein